MDSYEEYLNSIIDSTYDEIKPLLDRFNNIPNCPNCGGRFINANCKFCGFEKTEIKTIIEFIISKLKRFEDKIKNLPIKKMPINKLFNLLYTFKGDEISFINVFLSNYQYEKIIDEEFQKGFHKLTYEESILESEKLAIEAKIYKNDSNLSLDTLFNVFIIYAISRERTISYESFRELIKNYIEQKMKTYHSDPKCIIISTSEMSIQHKEKQTAGQASYNRIWMSEEEIRALYYEGSVAVITSMFHELHHIKQFKEFFNGYAVNAFIIKEIKELILTKYVAGYYEENYENISFELEAEYYALENSVKFLESLGFKLSDNRHKIQLEELKRRMDDNRRYFDGFETSVDILFEEYIYNHPELLGAYPQLKFLYTNNNGYIICKSDDELIDDYNALMDDPGCTNEDKEFYKRLYSYFLSASGRT